jgi:hypothetical protein
MRFMADENGLVIERLRTGGFDRRIAIGCD